MKAFFITLIAFALTLGLVIGNGIYLKKFIQDARAELNILSADGTDESITNIKEYASKSFKKLQMIEFSLPRNKTEAFVDKLDLLYAHAEAKEFFEFEKTKLLLDNLLTEIEELEKISLYSLL